MDREQFEDQYGCLEEYVLTYDPYTGPQITDLQKELNFVISEKEFEEILMFFKELRKKII